MRGSSCFGVPAATPIARAMFSATVSVSNSEKCWNTMPMPSPRACAGSRIFSGSPCQMISPSSGWVTP